MVGNCNTGGKQKSDSSGSSGSSDSSNGVGSGSSNGKSISSNGKSSRNRYWDMVNGYALPVNPTAMGALGARLAADPPLAAEAEASLRVGVHWYGL